MTVLYFDVSAQDCSNSSALVMELVQSCLKTLIYNGNLYTWKTSFINRAPYQW